MAITKYDWYVKTDIFNHFELRNELTRLNEIEFEIFVVEVIADYPERNTVKASIIARKIII